MPTQPQPPAYWRDALRRQSARAVSIGATAICVLVLLFFDPREYLGTWSAALAAAVSMFVVTRIERLDGEWVAGASTTTLLLGGGVAVFQLGWMPAPILLLTAAVVSAGLLLSRAAVIAIVAGCALVLFGVGYAMSSTAIPIPDGQPAMAEFSLWLRVSVFSSVCWIGLGLTTTYTVEAIEDSVRREQQAASQLVAERLARAEVERSRDAAQAAFVHAQRKAAIAAFAAGLAHDFNNALMVILSWADLLRSDMSDPELVSEANEAIATSGQQASAIARQLLSLGREHAGAPAIVDLAGLLALDVASLRKLMPQDIELRFESLVLVSVSESPVSVSVSSDITRPGPQPPLIGRITNKTPVVNSVIFRGTMG